MLVGCEPTELQEVRKLESWKEWIGNAYGWLMLALMLATVVVMAVAATREIIEYERQEKAKEQRETERARRVREEWLLPREQTRKVAPPSDEPVRTHYGPRG